MAAVPPEAIDGILLMATAVALCLYIPQLLHTYQSRDVTSFHKGTIMLRVFANALYATYSALESVYILFACSVMIMIFEATLLLMCFLYDQEGGGARTLAQGRTRDADAAT